MFNLSQKIEEIRQKPEHIRMRYVWAWVAVSMVFVFMVWIFSVKESFNSVNLDENNFSNLRIETPGMTEGSSSPEKESISNLEK